MNLQFLDGVNILDVCRGSSLFVEVQNPWAHFGPGRRTWLPNSSARRSAKLRLKSPPFRIGPGMFPPFRDFLTLSGLISAFSVLLGSAIGIHSLRQPNMSNGRLFALTAYAFLAVLVSIGLLFNGAYQEQHTREIDGKIDTIRAVLGSAPGTSGEEVLNHIIAKFSQPQVISPPQMAKMAHEIAFLKNTLPKTILIVRSQSNVNTASDFSSMYAPLLEMFERNGFHPDTSNYTPESINEAGLLLIVKDPSSPPDYINKFLASFELVGIRAKTAYIPEIYHENALVIFIGPPPI